MIKCNSVTQKLSNSQLENLKLAAKIPTEVISRLS